MWSWKPDPARFPDATSARRPFIGLARSEKKPWVEEDVVKRFIYPAIFGLLMAVGLAACAKKEADREDATAFFPPTNITRVDFAAGIAKRFARLDRNNDGILTADEMTGSRSRRFKAFDTNGDRELTLAEFTKGSLAAFDRADTNHDGTLTSDERRAARQAHAFPVGADNTTG
jgi:EF hand